MPRDPKNSGQPSKADPSAEPTVAGGGVKPRLPNLLAAADSSTEPTITAGDKPEVTDPVIQRPANPGAPVAPGADKPEGKAAEPAQGGSGWVVEPGAGFSTGRRPPGPSPVMVGGVGLLGLGVLGGLGWFLLAPSEPEVTPAVVIPTSKGPLDAGPPDAGSPADAGLPGDAGPTLDAGPTVPDAGGPVGHTAVAPEAPKVAPLFDSTDVLVEQAREKLKSGHLKGKEKAAVVDQLEHLAGTVRSTHDPKLRKKAVEALKAFLKKHKLSDS